MEWIKCSQRTPTDEENALYTWNGKHIQLGIVYSHHYKKWFEDMGGEYSNECNPQPTHWILAKLPEPPED